jgi:hypothetical protein
MVERRIVTRNCTETCPVRVLTASLIAIEARIEPQRMPHDCVTISACHRGADVAAYFAWIRTSPLSVAEEPEAGAISVRPAEWAQALRRLLRG